MSLGEIRALFEDWDAPLIKSFLQGHMGTLTVDDEANPQSALVDVGDFCFVAGKSDEKLLRPLRGFKLLLPKDEAWASLIEEYFGQRVKKIRRYAMKKEPDAFDREKLKSYIASLEPGFELRLFDKEIFDMARSEPWSADLCSQFRDYEDYRRRALGAAVLHEGKPVSGASTYAVYDDGIEIEIDTKPEYRRKGLATACAARLILECLSRGLYPAWDAHDLCSAALAEKLGYRISHDYVTYVLEDNS